MLSDALHLCASLTLRGDDELSMAVDGRVGQKHGMTQLFADALERDRTEIEGAALTHNGCAAIDGRRTSRTTSGDGSIDARRDSVAVGPATMEPTMDPTTDPTRDPTTTCTAHCDNDTPRTILSCRRLWIVATVGSLHAVPTHQSTGG